MIAVSAKHRETKQFYTIYNQNLDTKTYLSKELSLLNSIYENYNEYVRTMCLMAQRVITESIFTVG